MKILAVVESKHKGNTLKIAKAMAEAAPVTITDIENAPKYNFRDYDIVGFGSGIYYGKHDKKLLEFVGKFCDKKAYAFVFSTSGSDSVEKNNKALVDLLKSKNKVVLGSFGCKGYDKYFIFKVVGGINKGRPDEQDLKNAQKFILDIMKKYEEEK